MSDETQNPVPEEEVTETPPEQTGEETPPIETMENTDDGETVPQSEEPEEESVVALAEEIETIVTTNISKPNRGVMRMRIRRKVGQLLRQKFGYLYSVTVRATPDREGMYVKSKTPEGLVSVTVAIP